MNDKAGGNTPDPGVLALDPPILPQAVDGTLDLSSSAISGKGYVEVNIPGYANRASGDRITVWFGKSDGTRFDGCPVRYMYLGDTSETPPFQVRFEPLWSLPSQLFGVNYMVTSRSNNSSTNKHPTPVTTLNTPAQPAASGYQGSLFGEYLAGPLEYWVLAQSYTLAPATDIVMQSLQASTPQAKLGLYLNQATQPFAYLTTADGNAWQCQPNGAPTVALQRGDLVTLKLEDGQDAAIYLALAM